MRTNEGIDALRFLFRNHNAFACMWQPASLGSRDLCVPGAAYRFAAAKDRT